MRRVSSGNSATIHKATQEPNSTFVRTAKAAPRQGGWLDPDTAQNTANYLHENQKVTESRFQKDWNWHQDNRGEPEHHRRVLSEIEFRDMWVASNALHMKYMQAPQSCESFDVYAVRYIEAIDGQPQTTGPVFETPLGTSFDTANIKPGAQKFALPHADEDILPPGLFKIGTSGDYRDDHFDLVPYAMANMFKCNIRIDDRIIKSERDISPDEKFHEDISTADFPTINLRRLKTENNADHYVLLDDRGKPLPNSPDGNCLFYSTIQALNNDRTRPLLEQVLNLRALLVHHMAENWNSYYANLKTKLIGDA